MVRVTRAAYSAPILYAIRGLQGGRMLKRCENCQKFFNAIRSDQRFCETRCSILSRRSARKNYEPIKCAQCGALFKPIRNDQRFCTVNCKELFYSIHIEKKVRCAFCGKLFRTTTLKRTHCSPACAREAKAARDKRRREHE